MIKISVIGFGNVGQHLAKAFDENDNTDLVQVFSRSGTSSNVSFSHKIVDDLNDLKPADVYVISVSDRSVSEVSQRLPFSGKLVVHTAGSI